jgi:cytochrome P450
MGCPKARVWFISDILRTLLMLGLFIHLVWDGRRISGKRGSGAKEAAKGNLIGARDLKLHAEARKTWNKAFLPASIKGYEPILVRRVAQLVDALGDQKAGRVDLSQWLSYFS